MTPTDMVQRFNRTNRCAHWANASGFLVLLVTGVLMLLRRPLELGEHDVTLLLRIHLVAAFVYALGPSITWIIGDSASWWHWVRDASEWRPRDVQWLLCSAARVVNRQIKLPPQGRFNAGQRINIWSQLFLKMAFVVTGCVLLLRQGQLGTLYVHLLCTIIAVVLFLGHFYLSAINPGTRHSLRGIFTGWVATEWARHHHPLWVDKITKHMGQGHEGKKRD